MRKQVQIVLMAAVAAVLPCAMIARADDATPSPVVNQPRATEISPGVVAGVSRQSPLMNLLDAAGIGQGLEQAHINIFGRVEGSYNWNFDGPAKDLNIGRIFDADHNKGVLNQLDLNIERRVDLQSGQFDLGGRLEMLYGTDARFIHSNGLLDGSDYFHGAEYQFDLPQLYVDAGIPLGNGLRIRAGKFLFFKQIDPNASVFYSHSFIFGGALPFTNTGVTAYYPFTKQLSVEGGFSRGWDQSLKDNNGAIDALGRVRYSVTDKTDISLAAIIGPELDRDNSHYRTALDLAVTHQCNDHITLLVDAVYGYQAMPSGQTGAMWYGLAGYGVCHVNNYVQLESRLEWYRDEEGFTTGLAQSLFEGTLGATITPFPGNSLGQNFKLRPEVRYDYATARYFDGASRHDQTTVGIDAIFNF